MSNALSKRFYKLVDPVLSYRLLIEAVNNDKDGRNENIGLLFNQQLWQVNFPGGKFYRERIQPPQTTNYCFAEVKPLGQ